MQETNEAIHRVSGHFEDLIKHDEPFTSCCSDSIGEALKLLFPCLPLIGFTGLRPKLFLKRNLASVLIHDRKPPFHLNPLSDDDLTFLNHAAPFKTPRFGALPTKP